MQSAIFRRSPDRGCTTGNRIVPNALGNEHLCPLLLADSEGLDEVKLHHWNSPKSVSHVRSTVLKLIDTLLGRENCFCIDGSPQHLGMTSMNVNERIDISSLLTLRKVTRSISEYLGNLLTGNLDSMMPLFNPRPVFGERVRGGVKTPGRGSEEAFNELSGLYRTINGVKPFNLRREFDTPIDILSATPEVNVYSYSYCVNSNGNSKNIVVTSPLRWVLTYKGFGPARLRELLADSTNVGDDLQESLLHYLVMHGVLRNRPGIVRLLEAMRFQIDLDYLEEFGKLPFPVVSCPISTVRPGDETIFESTELSGTALFEEVANVDEIPAMSDPLKDELISLAKSQGAKLP